MLVDTVKVVLMSGDLLADLARSDSAKLAGEFWYTAQVRSRVAALLGVTPWCVSLVDANGIAISDDQSVTEEEPLTAIVGPEEPLVFDGALRV